MCVIIPHGNKGEIRGLQSYSYIERNKCVSIDCIIDEMTNPSAWDTFTFWRLRPLRPRAGLHVGIWNKDPGSTTDGGLCNCKLHLTWRNISAKAVWPMIMEAKSLLYNSLGYRLQVVWPMIVEQKVSSTTPWISRLYQARIDVINPLPFHVYFRKKPSGFRTCD